MRARTRLAHLALLALTSLLIFVRTLFVRELGSHSPHRVLVCLSSFFEEMLLNLCTDVVINRKVELLYLIGFGLGSSYGDVAYF